MKRMGTKLQSTFESKVRENCHENDIHCIQNGNANNSNAGQKDAPTASKLLPLDDKLHHPLNNLIAIRPRLQNWAAALGSKARARTHQQLRAAITQELDGVRHRTDCQPIIGARQSDCEGFVTVQYCEEIRPEF